jgi:homoserine O-acetyltransferase
MGGSRFLAHHFVHWDQCDSSVIGAHGRRREPSQLCDWNLIIVTAASRASRLGVIKPQHAHFHDALYLESGEVLDEFELVYETYGDLRSDGSNAILICHALSGNHHAAGLHSEADTKPGWWDTVIGPGKPIDTNRFFVVCTNNIGGCSGSTGPASISKTTGKPWGSLFPQVTVADWVESQKRLAQYLGINQWAAVVGGSLGGMQALQWSVTYPDWVTHCIVIAAAPGLTAQNIAFNEIARQAIFSDPDWCDGDYIDANTAPEKGMALRANGRASHLHVGRQHVRPIWS